MNKQLIIKVGFAALMLSILAVSMLFASGISSQLASRSMNESAAGLASYGGNPQPMGGCWKCSG